MKLRLLLPFLFTLPALAGEFADEARKLAGDFNRAKLAYVQKLDSLLAKAKAAGDTAAIKTIEDLIAEAEGKRAAGDDVLAPIVGTWKRDIDGAIWRFAADGTGTFNNKGKLAVSYDPEKDRFVSVADKSVDYFTVTRNPDVLSGTFESGERKLRFKLERVK